MKKEEMILNMDKKYNILFVLVILIAGVIAYSNSFDCSFHFDDKNIFKNIVDDVNVLQRSVTKDSVDIVDWISLFPTRILGVLTFAADYNIHKLDLWGYHLVNLTIHLINALLIWWLTLITFTTPVMKDESISRHKTIIAFLTGLLFVTHPLATQSVTYIVQRFASLATLFYLLSLILYIKGRFQENNKTTLLLFGASIVSAVCGMLTKETVFTLPFAIILYDYCFIKTSPWKLEIKDKNHIFPLIMLVIFIFIFLRNFSLNVFDTVEPDQGYSYSLSMKEYSLTQFRVILTYIRLFFLPYNQNFDYDYSVSTGFFQIETFFSFMVLLGILLSGILLFKKYRLISFGIFWFFLTLSVESSIIPISQNVIFEHRTYLPSFGFFIALTGAFFYFFREKYLKVAVIIILIIAAVNTILTYERNKIWKNEYTLWSDCMKKSPGKARPNDNFGLVLFTEGKTVQAIDHYNKAIRLAPGYANAYNNRGAAYAKLGQYQLAFEDFNKAIKFSPDLIKAYNNRAAIYGELGQYQHAIDNLNEAIRRQPYYVLAYYNRGFAYAKLGQYQLAIVNFNKAISMNQNYANAYDNRAAIYLNQGNIKLGCDDAQKACALGNCRTFNAIKGRGYCH